MLLILNNSPFRKNFTTLENNRKEKHVNSSKKQKAFAFFTACAISYWKSTEDLLRNRKFDHIFIPGKEENMRKALCSQWVELSKELVTGNRSRVEFKCGCKSNIPRHFFNYGILPQFMLHYLLRRERVFYELQKRKNGDF